MRQVFRPAFGRILTIVIAGICAVTLVAVVGREGWSGLLAAPWLALVAAVCWAVFWRPEVVVDQAGVRLVNIVRTIDLPWPSILAIDTKWALTLITSYGRFTGWATPAPGVRSAMWATKQDAEHLPESTFTREGIRPGDLPSSPSGGAAVVIRRHWQVLRDAGYLDNPRLERETVPVRWHVGTMAGGAALTALAIATLFL